MPNYSNGKLLGSETNAPDPTQTTALAFADALPVALGLGLALPLAVAFDFAAATVFDKLATFPKLRIFPSGFLCSQMQGLAVQRPSAKYMQQCAKDHSLHLYCTYPVKIVRKAHNSSYQMEKAL